MKLTQNTKPQKGEFHLTVNLGPGELADAVTAYLSKRGIEANGSMLIEQNGVAVVTADIKDGKAETADAVPQPVIKPSYYYILTHKKSEPLRVFTDQAVAQAHGDIGSFLDIFDADGRRVDTWKLINKNTPGLRHWTRDF